MSQSVVNAVIISEMLMALLQDFSPVNDYSSFVE